MNSAKFKKFTALLVTVMLVLGTCLTGVTVSAEEIEESYQLSTQAVTESETMAETMAETTVMAEPETTQETTMETEPAEVSEIPQLIGNSEIITEPDEEIIESDGITVYYDNLYIYVDEYGNKYESLKWDKVYVQYGNNETGDMVQWPGVEMDYYYIDDYEYYVTYSSERKAVIPADADYIIFNNGESEKTEKLNVPESGSVYKDGKWSEMKKKVYFSDRVTLWGDWDKENTGVYAYYWSDENDSMVQWPGVELKSYDNNYDLTAELPFDATHIIFHNNKGAKTESLVIPEKYYRYVYSTTLNKWELTDNSYNATGEYNLPVVVGDKELCGSDWEYNFYDSYENVMDGQEGNYYDEYTYTKTYKNVQPANNIQFKIADVDFSHGHYYDGKTNYSVKWYGDENGNDITFNVTKACDVTITYDYTYSWEDGNIVSITVEGDGVVMSSDAKEDLFKYRVLDDGTISIVAYTKTDFDYEDYENKFEVNIPETIDGYKVTSIDGAFAYNSWVDVKSIPDSVTNIGNCTFMTTMSEYSEDNYVELGNNIKSVGDFAYYIYNSERYSDYYGSGNVFVVPASVTKLGKHSIPWGSSIHGYTGTEAERYADETPCKFISKSNGKVVGDINIDLVNDLNGSLTGEVVLANGSYDFKIQLGDKTYGGAYTINDKAAGATYSTAWKKSSTLNATGGKYAFRFDTVTERLYINRIAEVSEIKLVGDVEATLKNSKNDPYVFIGTVSLGSYRDCRFKVEVDGVEYGSNGYYYGSMSNVQYSDSWTSSTTIETGYYGSYTFTFDVRTNRLTAIPLREASSVNIVGDIDLSLEQVSENLYSGTVELEAGTYGFKIDIDDYYTYCFGYTFKDYILNAQYSTSWNSNTNFIATGGTYKFTFDTATNRLTVYPVK